MKQKYLSHPDELHASQAEVWDRWVDSIDKESDSHRANRFLSEEKNRPPYLDIGCGPGRFLEELALQGEREIYGIDISKAMIQRAHDHLRPFLGDKSAAQIRVGDMLKIDSIFPGTLFKTIFLSRVLQQTYRRIARSVMEAVARVSAPNARIILSVRSISMEPTKIPAIPNEAGSYRHRAGWIKTYYSEADLGEAVDGLFEFESLKEHRSEGPYPINDWIAVLRPITAAD